MATQRASVNISLTPELDTFLQKRVKSGRYQTASEAVREALRLLERQERERDEEFTRLRAKLMRGEDQATHGELRIDESVFHELRDMIEERRRSAVKTKGKRKSSRK